MARYELVEGTSSKFWEIAVEGNQVITRYGRIGTAGSSSTKELASAAAAQKELDKLVAEKTRKGYRLVEEGAVAAASAPKATTAFRLADLEQLDDRPFDHAEKFMGLAVVGYDPEEGLKDAARKAWRLAVDDGEGDLDDWLALLQSFADDPKASEVKALVVGAWDENVAEGVAGDDGPGKVVSAIAAVSARLPKLAAIFLGDIHADEAEVSWQIMADVAPLLAAYPQLQHLRVRGNPGSAEPKKLQSEALRSLQFEGSNLDASVLRQLAEADLPALEHLEVWLGPDDYSRIENLDDLTPILSGKLFPSLRVLALRDSDKADEVARRVVGSALLERLETLDLSLGTLGDEGAEALLSSPAVAKLKTLDIRHHYISAPVLKRLKALKPVRVIESRAEEDGDEDERYVAVAE